MSLISASDLSKNFGPLDLFAGLTFAIPPRARVAIVGPNGIGKTTLLRILAGLEPPSGGTVSRAKNLRIGYLPQESVLESDLTLREECLAVFADLRRMEAELAELEQAMADPQQAQEAMERYGSLQTEFEHRGGYSYPVLIQQVLGGLGFDESEFDMPLMHLSGGQRTRAVLARLLLSNPDLLILDEPTNHLDIAAVEWLESYLNQWEGGVLIVSHDRYFLDRVCNAIWEMGRGRLEMYRGNYTDYLDQREARWDLRRQEFEAQIEQLTKDLDYARRNIAGQRTQQAKGKLKIVSRMIQAIEQLGIDGVAGRSWLEISQEASTTTSPMGIEEAERRLRALRLPDHRPLQLHLDLSSRQRSGNLVLRTRNLLVGYPGNPLFTSPDLELRRLECAALIGPNGAGKTTFLKTILEKLPPLAGEVKLGASLVVGYFAQAHEDLQPENNLMQEIERAAPQMLPGRIRDYLARYLFSGDDVFKKISMLSGGERSRLALARLALSDANLLLLDEPTNHLDIPSQEVLQKVLQEFDGTILMVSHDRYLIDALATQIWEVNPDESALQIFKGNYSQFQQEKQKQREQAVRAREETRQGRSAFERQSRERNQRLADERRRQARLEAVENRIHELEKEQVQISRQLETPSDDHTLVLQLGARYAENQEQLEQLMEEWADLHEAQTAA